MDKPKLITDITIAQVQNIILTVYNGDPAAPYIQKSAISVDLPTDLFEKLRGRKLYSISCSTFYNLTSPFNLYLSHNPVLVHIKDGIRPYTYQNNLDSDTNGVVMFESGDGLFVYETCDIAPTSGAKPAIDTDLTGDLFIKLKYVYE